LSDASTFDANTIDRAVRDTLVGMISAKSPLPADVGPDFDYIESGHVDSIGLIHFMLGLEENFGIEISDDDMQSDEFRTIGGLAALIGRKRSARGS
jgi:acyl carrier protein